VIPAFVLLIAAAFSAAPQLRAQPQAPTPMTFEVASIRPHAGEVTQVAVFISGPQVRIVAYGLTGLIMDAFHRQRYQISGLQGWMDSDRYDIVANAPTEDAPTSANVETMVRALLVERFGLKFHLEKRESPVYALVVGKSGPKLKESTADHLSVTVRSARSNQLTVAKATMDLLAIQLSSSVDRPVFDKTGLRGFYDVTLDWTSDYGGPPAADPNGVDIFTALQEQLGLKLEPQKAPIEMLVIDHAQRPSEN
jgi:uncharacterized protein (TIGR03435 family)